MESVELCEGTEDENAIENTQVSVDQPENQDATRIFIQTTRERKQHGSGFTTKCSRTTSSRLIEKIGKDPAKLVVNDKLIGTLIINPPSQDIQ